MARTTPRPAKSAAYLVLGMHRSGTSAVTQLLALAGAELPQNVMPGDEHNAKGYFEPWKIALFNDARLRAAGSAWDDVFALPYTALAKADEAAWTARALALYHDEFGEARFPLLKDPRVSVLAPLWRQVLKTVGLPARAVIPVRSPLAVAGSLARRDGFPVEKSVLLWCVYMLAAELYSRDLPRAFVSYDGLLADWRGEVSRIEAAHGAPLPRMSPHAEGQIDQFLTGDLRHNSGGGDLAAVPIVGPLAKTVHDWFEAAAAGPHPPLAPLEAAAVQIAELKAKMGVFVSPVTSALSAASAELDEERQQRQRERLHTQEIETELVLLRRERAAIEAEVDAMLAAR
ncbi:MAG: hypothetical protein KA085_12760 [Phenylobacterium sp.]|uniref:sulfotransferase family protein n=1 Tax=Phenylobacterium sp. TaxID=1871053 RepID=UPI001B6B566B|nr:hypothetical protein [Phenylobacterium sp.]MBP7651404.1 hypothetical protein [Phenylobacterium sp.]MBP7816994.1 hypothetical protein [Phenylobacterium sp.]MBP9230385.1 hypothetical protein [Phenylobacterium sp.]MBP9756027.1 hypothetical protein [Phenylobacterium sp.]